MTPPSQRPARRDNGSVTPLVIGMLLCLLILGAGVTAAGSAFLAGQRLQHLCDGAAAAAAGTITDNGGSDNVDAAVIDYLAARHAAVTAVPNLEGTTLTLTCDTESAVTFGALFAHPTLHRTVTSSARARYQPG